jgi:hypothetical protein
MTFEDFRKKRLLNDLVKIQDLVKLNKIWSKNSLLGYHSNFKAFE